MNSDDALFELSLMNAEGSSAVFDDFYIWGTSKGIPPEILTRLKVLWDYTKDIAGETVAVGKIIVTTIRDFMISNQQIAIGVAIGAAVGLLTASIPFLGAALAPLGTILSSVYGAGVGAALENGETTADATSPIVAAINLAKKFFELLVAVFRAVQSHISD